MPTFTNQEMMKKYDREEICRMSLEQLCQTICNELNDNGFEYYIEYNGERIGPLAFSVPDTRFPGSLQIFYSQIPKDGIEFLKGKGLLNNGRCALCGAEIDSGEYVYSEDGRTYHICGKCNNIRQLLGHAGPINRTEMINRAGRQGCLVAFALLPFFAIKSLLFG